MPPKYTEAMEAGSSGTDTSDLDSLYDSENGSITDTLTSGWFSERTQYLHGRRYHSTGDKPDLIPNDDIQQDQQDLFHAIYTRAISLDLPEGSNLKLHLSPIPEKPHRVLDVGTGTGIWAVDFADENPSAEVVGFDKTPIQPTWIPPNLSFQIEDLTNDWTFKQASFDLVYLRAMHPAVFNWPKLFQQTMKVLKPGGYVEIYSELPKLHSDDDTLPDDWPFVKWLNTMGDALKGIGLNNVIDTFIEKDIKDAGFKNVEMKYFKVPVGPWAKDKKMKQLGAMFLVNMLQGLEGWTLTVFTQMLGKSHEETMAFIEEIKKSLRNKKVHSYMKFYCIYAQKPMVEGSSAA